jgi:molybdenum cofactor guanylyltransferase
LNTDLNQDHKKASHNDSPFLIKMNLFMNITTYTLVINAGGQSRRMQQEKALLPLPTSGLPLLAHMVQRLRTLPLAQIVVVTNNPHLPAACPLEAVGPPVRWLTDAYPGMGALGGLVTGLALCRDWGIFVACDLPLVNAALFAQLCTLTHTSAGQAEQNYDAIIPIVAGHAQVFHALYHRRALPTLVKQLTQGELSVHRALAATQVRQVCEAELRPFDPQLHSFFNTNTPAEWAEACRLLELEHSQ